MREGMSEMVSSPCFSSMANSGMCSGTPCWRASSHRATTVLEVPKSTARRPGMNLSLHNGLMNRFPLVGHPPEADGHRLARLGLGDLVDGGMLVGVKRNLIAGLTAKDEA